MRLYATLLLSIGIGLPGMNQPLLDQQQLSAHYTTAVMMIDGDLKEWTDGIHEIKIQDRVLKQGGKQRVLSDNEMTVRALWDSSYLYVVFAVTDQDLRAIQTLNDHPQLYLDDMVEILLDPRYDHTDRWQEDDIVYHINLWEIKKDDRGTPQGESDSRWNGKAHYAVALRGSLNDSTDTDTGYTIEFAIPWSELGLRPVEQLRLGFDVANGDNDGKGRQLFDWTGAWPLRSPDQFGEMILVR